MNNQITDIEMVANIADCCPNLVRLCLLGNVVSNVESYRLYVIYKMRNLRVLDFKKVTKQERIDADALFSDGQKEKVLLGSTKTKPVITQEKVNQAEEIKRLSELIDKAQSLEEIQKLEAKINEL